MKRERRTSDQHGVIDKMRQELRQEMEKEKCREIENLQAEHAKQIRQLKERHQQLVSEIKKKQWVCLFNIIPISKRYFFIFQNENHFLAKFS